MTILENITAGRTARPQKVCIYAPEGFGKSTLAAQFPDPLFLDVEDSTSQLPVKRLGRAVLSGLPIVESALGAVAAERPCATLVIDTLDWLEQLALDEIIAAAKNPKIKGIEDFGYGKGYTILRERMLQLLARLDDVIAAGIHVVLLAHARTVKFEPPDGGGAWDRFELKLTRHVAPLVKEWADMLLFGHWQAFPQNSSHTGAHTAAHDWAIPFTGVGGRERLLHCSRSSGWDAKNRHGMADAERWDIRVIERAFRSVGASWGEPPAAVPARLPVPALPPGVAQRTGADWSDPSDPSDRSDLAKICTPHADAINDYLRANHRVKPGEDWRAMSAEFAARVLRNPAGFLRVALQPRPIAA